MSNLNESSETQGGIPVASSKLQQSQRSTIGRVWVFLSVAVASLLLLLVFIIQNNKPIHINYLGLSGSISLGIAILLAAVVGSLLTLVIGSARILQLKHIQRK